MVIVLFTQIYYRDRLRERYVTKHLRQVLNLNGGSLILHLTNFPPLELCY